MDVFNSELFKQLGEDAHETIQNGGTYAAQFDDALVILFIDDETYKVNVIMGDAVKYAGRIIDFEDESDD